MCERTSPALNAPMKVSSSRGPPPRFGSGIFFAPSAVREPRELLHVEDVTALAAGQEVVDDQLARAEAALVEADTAGDCRVLVVFCMLRSVTVWLVTSGR